MSWYIAWVPEQGLGLGLCRDECRNKGKDDSKDQGEDDSMDQGRE